MIFLSHVLNLTITVNMINCAIVYLPGWAGYSGGCDGYCGCPGLTGVPPLLEPSVLGPVHII